MWKISSYKPSASAEILLYGEIGSDFGGVDATDFYNDVTALDAPEITFRINSYGGDVFAGNAIYNQIRRLDALTTTAVDGVAASIASVIAMAGDRVTMAPNSMLMIHNAWTAVSVAGDANALEQSAEEIERMTATLRAIDENIVAAYSARANVGEEQLKDWMDRETWFTAEESIQIGFADEIVEGIPVAALAVPDGKFRNVPETLIPRAIDQTPLRSQSRARLGLVLNLTQNPNPVD